MKLRPFLITFYGVELVPVASKQTTTQRRRFEPFIKEFVDYDAAVAWAKENIDVFLYGEHKWLLGSRIYEVRSVAEISADKYMRDKMSDEAKKKIQTDLKKIVLDFMDARFEKEYEMILSHSQKSKVFANESAKHAASAEFMINPIRRACEKELSFHSTFHGADLAPKIKAILELYFLDRESESKYEKSSGASN